MLPDRPNLFLDFREWDGHWGDERMTDDVINRNLQWLSNIVTNPQCPKSLLFVPSTKVMKILYSWLFEVLVDHDLEPCLLLDQVCGGSSSQHKASTLDRFCSGSLRVVICTSVWGAGIDFPNVGLVVVFWSGGQSLRDDWQEGGRAGR